MMKENTQKLYELTAQANDLFIEKVPNINTSVGLMNKALRNKGINADAVMVDVIGTNNRLIFILLDSDTNTVGIGLGNIAEDKINLVEQVALNSLSDKVIANKLMQYLA